MYEDKSIDEQSPCTVATLVTVTNYSSPTVTFNEEHSALGMKRSTYTCTFAIAFA